MQWSLEYSFARMQRGPGGPTYEAFPAPQVITVEQAGCGIALAHQLAESAAFRPANFETDGLLLVRLYRDATNGNGADTYAGDAFLHTFDIHHEVGQLSTTNRVRGDGWVP